MPLRCAAMKKKSRVTAFFGGNMIDNATFLCYTYYPCGRGGMADALVLGTNALGVQVQVLSPAPR